MDGGVRDIVEANSDFSKNYALDFKGIRWFC